MKKGFTLVELSIVIVIIGLLVGGILVGQSLIESAKLQSFVRQIEQYRSAVLLFEDRYRDLPGDTNKLSPQGNNDGEILGSENENFFDLEIGNFWYHLSQGLAVGDFIGTGASTGLFTLPENVMPKVEYGEGGQIVAGYSYYEGFNEPLNNENVFWVIDPPSQSRFVEGGAGNCEVAFTDKECDYPFTPIQALAYDKKTDDGMPHTGNVMAAARADFGLPRSGANPCVSAGNLNPSATYVITETEKTCALMIRMSEE